MTTSCGALEGITCTSVTKEPIPEGNPVYLDGSLVVVGKTFEEVVSNKNQDVFMLLGGTVHWRKGIIGYPPQFQV